MRHHRLKWSFLGGHKHRLAWFQSGSEHQAITWTPEFCVSVAPLWKKNRHSAPLNQPLRPLTKRSLRCHPSSDHNPGGEPFQANLRNPGKERAGHLRIVLTSALTNGLMETFVHSIGTTNQEADTHVAKLTNKASRNPRRHLTTTSFHKQHRWPDTKPPSYSVDRILNDSHSRTSYESRLHPRPTPSSLSSSTVLHHSAPSRCLLWHPSSASDTFRNSYSPRFSISPSPRQLGQPSKHWPVRPFSRVPGVLGPKIDRTTILQRFTAALVGDWTIQPRSSCVERHGTVKMYPI